MRDVSSDFTEDVCSLQSSSLAAVNAIFFANNIITLVANKLFYYVFRGPLYQPHIVPEFIMALILGNLERIVDFPIIAAYDKVDVIAMSTYMFVLDLEMEPGVILEPPGLEATVAYISLVTSWIVSSLSYAIFNSKHSGGVDVRHPVRIIIGFVVMLSATSSPIVTRMTTDLNLGKSEIGKRAIRACIFNDMICTLLMAVLMGFRFTGALTASHSSTALKFLELLFYQVTELCFVVVVGRRFLQYMNDRNPEGKPIRGMDMLAVIVFTQGLCYLPMAIKYDTTMNAFLVGLFLPREGRMSNFIISKTNYALNSLVLPLYISMVGLNVKFILSTRDHQTSATQWRKLIVILTMSTVGKLLGSLIAGKYQGLHWLEAITLGLLLNVKGHFQIFFTFYTKKKGLMDDMSALVFVLTVMLSIVFVPTLVTFIVKYVRLKVGKPQLMGLQWHHPKSHLRIVLGLHGPHNVPAATTLIEMMRGTDAAAGLEVFAMDMIEMTDKIAATLVYGHRDNLISIKDETVIVLRDEISSALDVYMDDVRAVGEGDGLRIKRTLAISSFADMHDDICLGAQDCHALIIILPFHRRMRVDGSMEDGRTGFRTVNRNVLQNASCSVGILVDRGLGHGPNMLSGSMSMVRNVAVIFIGGADDREALAYAGCNAHNYGVRLMVVRFILDEAAIRMGRGHGRRMLDAMNKSDYDMRVDDECFAGFYDHFVVGRGVGYMEKSVVNGAELVTTLRAMEGEYQLFVVGQGEKRDSILTSGMSEWAEYPELGPIGDILATPDFSVSASVLVIQQHDLGDSKYISDDFMPL